MQIIFRLLCMHVRKAWSALVKITSEICFGVILERQLDVKDKAIRSLVLLSSIFMMLYLESFDKINRYTVHKR